MEFRGQGKIVFFVYFLFFIAAERRLFLHCLDKVSIICRWLHGTRENTILSSLFAAFSHRVQKHPLSQRPRIKTYFNQDFFWSGTYQSFIFEHPLGIVNCRLHPAGLSFDPWRRKLQLAVVRCVRALVSSLRAGLSCVGGPR